MRLPLEFRRTLTLLLDETSQGRRRRLHRLPPSMRPLAEELADLMATPHPLFGLGAVHAKPRRAGRRLLRGVLSTNLPERLLPLLDPEHWVVILTTHNAVPMPRHPLADLYMADKAILRTSPRPGIPLSFRDFTSEDDFFPVAVEKTYDVFLNACFLPLKRAHLLLDAMIVSKRAGRPLSALFVGYHWSADSEGGTSHALERSLREKIQECSLDVVTPEPCWDLRSVNVWYNQSRLAVLPSSTEAGPRVMAEAFLANVPYIGARDCRGGSIAYLSPLNGEASPPEPRALARCIWRALDRLDQYQPRRWALEHMCRRVALQRLRRCIREFGDRHSLAINLDVDATASLSWRWYHSALRAELEA